MSRIHREHRSPAQIEPERARRHKAEGPKRGDPGVKPAGDQFAPQAPQLINLNPPVAAVPVSQASAISIADTIKLQQAPVPTSGGDPNAYANLSPQQIALDILVKGYDARVTGPGPAAAATAPPATATQIGHFNSDGSVKSAGFLPGGQWLNQDGTTGAPPADQVARATPKDLEAWKPVIADFVNTFTTGSGPYGRPWIPGGHVHPGHDVAPWQNQPPAERSPESFYGDLTYDTASLRNLPIGQIHDMFGPPGSPKFQQFAQMLKDAAVKANAAPGPEFNAWATQMEGIGAK